MMYHDVDIGRVTCELYRMMRYGWTFCEDCMRKVNVEDLVDYRCPECALRLHVQNRAVVHPEQQPLITITPHYQYAAPEGSVVLMEET